MESTIPSECPNTVTFRRNPHRSARPRTMPATAAPGISVPSSTAHTVPFPTDEILAMDISKPKPDLENLRVFLRIRPLLLAKRNSAAAAAGARSKNVWPQKKDAAAREQKTKKKRNPNAAEVCVKVNSARSVIVSPPIALQEPNRLKSEVYDGFSGVFSADSSQAEVYEMMVKPLVNDFLKGKSGMLAAMGPSGSGKTHTVFGSPREPGMVPLALQHIFKKVPGSNAESPRLFFISMFEISSERGKAEKWIDLSPNGGEISMQQSTLKGLQEIAISDAREAESLVAQAMQKRATATTNSNSQSSRSQCIINIRGVSGKLDGVVNNQANEVVLSIVDLAGAEREKRTGNQGARLLESNFINNTSMVFGLCLRSLLEHQKNPKKPMQKHFQNSLLTKYMRDYLEGKKRMSLILTVKSGEEDYRDTSHLLRQASPYMEIKFNNAEDRSDMPNKRHIPSLSRTEQRKRIKLTDFGSSMVEQEINIEPENRLSKEVAERICKVDSNSSPKPSYVDSAKEDRNHQIMQNFAKALWNVLKEYNKSLKVKDNKIQCLEESLMAEKTRHIDLEKELKDKQVKDNKIQRLEESLMAEKTRHIELEKELNDIKSCCTCSHIKSNADQASYSGRCSNDSTPKRLNSAPKVDQDSFVEVQGFGCVGNEPHIDATISQCQTDESQVDATVKSSDVVEVSASHLGPGNTDQQNHQMSQDLSGHSLEDECESKCVTLEEYPNADLPVVIRRKDSCSSVEIDDLLSEEDEESSDVAESRSSIDRQSRLDTFCEDLHLDKPERRDLPASSLSPKKVNSAVKNQTEKSHESSNLPTAPKDVSAKKCTNGEPKGTKSEKPKRRLLPASSALLRNISALDIEDENEKPKGGKKTAVDATRTRTQGSISLVRLLQSNLRS